MGPTTKIHGLIDAEGQPINLKLKVRRTTDAAQAACWTLAGGKFLLPCLLRAAGLTRPLVNLPPGKCLPHAYLLLTQNLAR